MTRDARSILKHALSLHSRGNLAAAERAYKELLAGSPENPFLLGQLGALYLAQSRISDAEPLFIRALAEGGPTNVYLRNLQVCVSLLMRKGDLDQARELVSRGVPNWPKGKEPKPAERRLLFSLAQSLIILEKPEQGLRLLDQAYANRIDDADLLITKARLRLASGDAEGAARLLERATTLAPNSPAALIALSAAQERLRRRSDARATVQQIMRRFGYLRKQRKPEHSATILVINPPPRRIWQPDLSIEEVHFRVNFPSQFQKRMERKYQFLSVFGNIAPDSSPWADDAPALVLNNLVSEKEMARPGSVERVRALIDRIGVPVINSPEGVARVSREMNMTTLSGISGLIVPRLARYDLGEVGVDAVIADIGNRIGYPVILRRPFTHSSGDTLQRERSKGVYLASTSDEVREMLARSGWTEFYAIEFVDLKKKNGWYRKIRAVCVGEEINIFHGGCFDHWVVHGWFTKPEGSAFYRKNPAAVNHIRAILNDPEAELGVNTSEILHEIRKRIPLDIFAIDFDVDQVGQVVFFEASAGMIISDTNEYPPDLRLPREPFERIHDAFHRLVAQRIGDN